MDAENNPISVLARSMIRKPIEQQQFPFLRLHSFSSLENDKRYNIVIIPGVRIMTVCGVPRLS